MKKILKIFIPILILSHLLGSSSLVRGNEESLGVNPEQAPLFMAGNVEWSGFCAYAQTICTEKNYLSPKLQINTSKIRQGMIPRVYTEPYCYSQAFAPDFPMHMRPFEALCNISRRITEEEGVLIYLEILDEHGNQLLEVNASLSDVAQDMADDDLSVYKKGILPVMENLTETVITFRIKKEHYFKISFIPSISKSDYSPSPEVLSLFSDFFAKKAWGKRG